MNHHLEAQSKTVFGFWVFLMSDCILFATLFATYAVFQTSHELVALPRTLLETLLLLTASFACGLASVAAERHKKKQALIYFAIVFLLGASFISMVGSDFCKLIQAGSSWQKSAFLSAFFNLVGTLSVHLLVGLLWVAVVGVQILCRGLTPAVLRRTACLKLFWHFLNIMWIFIFTFVYLMGAAAHAG